MPMRSNRGISAHHDWLSEREVSPGLSARKANPRTGDDPSRMVAVNAIGRGADDDLRKGIARTVVVFYTTLAVGADAV